MHYYVFLLHIQSLVTLMIKYKTRLKHQADAFKGVFVPHDEIRAELRISRSLSICSAQYGTRAQTHIHTADVQVWWMMQVIVVFLQPLTGENWEVRFCLLAGIC